MSNQFLIGLDVGGGSGRCLLVNTQTGAVTVTRRTWQHPPAPGTGGWGYNLETGRIWEVLGELAREALTLTGADPAEVVGIGATSMRHSTVLIDADGEVLFATPNRDARASQQAMALAGDFGEELYAQTGHWPNPVLAGARLRWLAENDPAVLEKAASFLTISDWVGYRLTGNVAADPSQAAESMVYDLHKDGWSNEIIDQLNLPEGIFPPLLAPGQRLGELREDAAAHLGLQPGIPVAVGGADTQMGLLGMGAVKAGQLGIVAGTTTPIQLVTGAPVIDSQRRLWAGRYVVPGLYVLESNAGGMGESMEWIARVLYRHLPDPVAGLCAEAGQVPTGARGIKSNLGVQVFNASELTLPVDTLTLSTMAGSSEADRPALARAVLEGLAYSARANVEQIGEAAGQDFEELWLAGGMSQSDVWAQILADVLNLKVHLAATPESTGLGAAICAGAGAGMYADLTEGAGTLTAVKTLEPEVELVKRYHSLYHDWTDLRESRRQSDALAGQIFLQSLAEEQAAAEAAQKAEAGFSPRILVTADMAESALDELRQLGEVTYNSYRQELNLLTDDALVEALDGYHVFVTEVDIVDAEALKHLPELRFVAVCRGNPVNVDIPACTAAGVPVVNTPGRNADAVADITLGFILMLARKLPEAAAFLRQPGGEAGDMGRMGMAFDRLRGQELWGKTVGLVGGGAIGKKVAERLFPYGAHVLVADPYISNRQAALMGAEKTSLEALLRASDFVSLHAPVTEETRNMIDANALARMKPGAFLVNTARAALIDDEALVAALQEGHLGGAALDVFAVEPPGADDPLLQFENVIATPHIGGNTYEVGAHQGHIVATELRRLLAGQQPEHLLNPKVMTRFSWTGERVVSEEVLDELAQSPGPGVSDLQVEGQKEKKTPIDQPVKEIPAAPAVAAEKKGGLLGGIKKLFSGDGEEPAPAPQDAGAGSEIAANMRNVLEDFMARIARDEKLTSFSQGKNVVMRFLLSDMEQVFYLSFVDGTVEAQLGEPPGDYDVDLKMSADTLDGMFTGRIGGMKAAMTGKLSFSGDTGKAMAFQRIQNDMNRLYTEALEEIGAPGDLTQIGAAPAIESPAASAPPPEPSGEYAAPVRGVAGYITGIPTPIQRLGDIRDEIVAVTTELFHAGLITATGGNVSARTPGKPDEIWMTPSQIFKGDLQPEMMVRIDVEGNPLDEDSLSASSERRVHCAVYRRRPDVDVVIHTHAPWATILALAELPFLPISTEAAFFDDLPRVPFIMPGTEELGEAVGEAMVTGAACLMQNHGLVVAGSSLRRAADLTYIIEVTAHKLVECAQMGVKPPVLPLDVVDQLREIGKLMA